MYTQTVCFFCALFLGGINIYQSDQIRTLGMIWMLIQKYQMRIHGKKLADH